LSAADLNNLCRCFPDFDSALLADVVTAVGLKAYNGSSTLYSSTFGSASQRLQRYIADIHKGILIILVSGECHALLTCHCGCVSEACHHAAANARAACRAVLHHNNKALCPVQQGQQFSAASLLMEAFIATQCSCLPLQSVSEDAHVASLRQTNLYHTHSRLLAICQQSCQELSIDMSCPSWHTTGPQETYLWRSCKCRPGCWHVPVSDLDGAAALCCWPYGMGRRPVSQHLLRSMYNACLPQGVFTVHSV